jgi:signal transduction histidine kinase
MRTPGLAGWLAIVTALLVSLAVGAVSMFGIQTLRGLAEAEALTRVELGLSAAREAVRQSTEDLVTAARVLGERPTLQRMLQAGNREPMLPYLTRYCEGAAFDGCAVVRTGTSLAIVGEGLDWPLIFAAAAEQGEGFMVTGAADSMALLGAQSGTIGHDGVTVYAVRLMDAGFEQRLTERAGLDIQLVDYMTFRAGEGSFAVLDSDALARGESVAGHVPALAAYAASQPLSASTGEVIALLHAVLPAERAMRRVDRMTNRMLLVGIVVALLATTAGVMIGRFWIGGIQRLTWAARRLASGDLATSMPAAGGREVGLLARTMEDMRRSLVDLTDELRQREAEAQAVLGGIVEGVYAVDRDRRIRFLNSQAEKLLGLSAEEATGRFCGDVLKPVRDAEGNRPCEQACPIILARRNGHAEAVERVQPCLGHLRRVVIASAAPSDGIQVQVLRDETELEAARRTRDTVLANISHEFRTPLAAQLASIELLRDGLGNLSTQSQQELVASLERGAQRLTWLIDNLLESVRIESGQLGIRRQDLQLADIIAASLDLIGPLIHQRGQRVLTELPEDLPDITGDEQRLIQVMVNLLANANKFAPANTTIRIGAESRESGRVAFWVEDEGSGPVDLHDSALFEQFRRSGGEDPEESGLGLGLYIVRSIVERHGGSVSLKRTADAHTRAEVVIPLEEQNENTTGR